MEKQQQNQQQRLIEFPKNSHQILFELPTGYGKTYNALRYLQEKKCHRPLVVLPKKVLVENWNAEIRKWNLSDSIKPIYIQYASFIKPHKWVFEPYDSIIFDEAHHISERCFDVIKNRKESLTKIPVCFLSATVSYEQKVAWRSIFTELFIVRASIQAAVNNNILPTPIIAYVKMNLDIRSRAFYEELQEECNKLKLLAEQEERVMAESPKRKIYLHKCKARNVWLAKQKNEIIKKIYAIYSDYRSITFCADIDHCKSLGNDYDITSKSEDAVQRLEDFNNKKINRVSACSILDEGVNVKDCQLGIFAYLTASNKLTIQRVGRILRHEKPIVYVLYYANTREEEIKELFESKFKGASIPKYYTENKIYEVYNKKFGSNYGR